MWNGTGYHRLVWDEYGLGHNCIIGVLVFMFRYAGNILLTCHLQPKDLVQMSWDLCFSRPGMLSHC